MSPVDSLCIAWVIKVIGLTIERATKAMAATLTRKQAIKPMPSESISRLAASDKPLTIEYESAVIAFRILPNIGFDLGEAVVGLTEHHCRHRRIGPADIENVPGRTLVFLQFLAKPGQLRLDPGGEILPGCEFVETGPNRRKIGFNFVAQFLQKLLVYAVAGPGHVAKDPHMRGNH